MRRMIVMVCVAAALAAACTTPNEVNTDLSALKTAEDTAATATLQTAVTVAGEFSAGSGSMTGFNAAQAAQLEPALHWVDGGEPPAGGVSIRGVTATDVVLVTKAKNGDALCLAITSGTQTMGKVDAGTAADCTGGW